MKTLHQYITRNTLITLFVTLGVFTFVLMLGNLMQKLSQLLVNKQVGLDTIAYFVLLMMPYMFSFSLPMAMLASALLVFGRLSADNEITAMRASGISLWSVAAPVILLAIVLSGLCTYINLSIAPQTKFMLKTLFLKLGSERPLALLDEGTYIKDFPGYVLYVGRKKANIIEDVTLYTLNNEGNVITSLRARKGIVSANPAAGKLVLDLYDVRGDLRDPKDPTNMKKIRAGTTAQRYPVELDLREIMHRVTSQKKISDLVVTELIEEIRGLRAQGVYPSAALMEVHQRFSMAVACISFTLIGIPLGLKASRRETSIGIALSLGLALCYYFMLVLANTFKNRPYIYPEAILWFPNLAFDVIGVWLLWRVSRV